MPRQLTVHSTVEFDGQSDGTGVFTVTLTVKEAVVSCSSIQLTASAEDSEGFTLTAITINPLDPRYDMLMNADDAVLAGIEQALTDIVHVAITDFYKQGLEKLTALKMALGEEFNAHPCSLLTDKVLQLTFDIEVTSTAGGDQAASEVTAFLQGWASVQPLA